MPRPETRFAGLDTPLLGFAAFSGTGKTTLLKRVIPLLREAGLRLAVVKHAHHHFEVDYPGKIKVTVIRETRAVEYAR